MRLMFTDKEARLYFLHPSYYMLACTHVCVCMLVYAISFDLSRGQPRDSRSPLHVSFLARIAMRVCRARLPRPSACHIFFSASLSTTLLQQTLSMCEENDLGPTRPLAGPRGSHDRRLDHQFFVRAEPSRAEPIHASSARSLAHPAHSASSSLTGH